MLEKQLQELLEKLLLPGECRCRQQLLLTHKDISQLDKETDSGVVESLLLEKIGTQLQLFP